MLPTRPHRPRRPTAIREPSMPLRPVEHACIEGVSRPITWRNPLGLPAPLTWKQVRATNDPSTRRSPKPRDAFLLSDWTDLAPAPPLLETVHHRTANARSGHHRRSGQLWRGVRRSFTLPSLARPSELTLITRTPADAAAPCTGPCMHREGSPCGTSEKTPSPATAQSPSLSRFDPGLSLAASLPGIREADSEQVELDRAS